MPDTAVYNQYVDQPFQTTVQHTVTLEGIGLHSGRFVEMSICPSSANTGIKFQRTDVDAKVQNVHAHAKFAEPASLCTRIVNNKGIGLKTIEHIMAAFAGVGLDNAVIKINAPEVPILDGSSQPFVEALQIVGLECLPVRRKHIIVTKTVTVKGDDGSWARLEPFNGLRIDVEIDFADKAIGNQQLTYHHCDGSFLAELANARTFCQLSDVQLMKNAGLALGGSLNNALVVNNGVIMNEGGLRMEREFVRHKTLDCLGDLLLLGMHICAKMTTFRPGHALSTKLIQDLLDNPAAFKIVEAGATQRHSDSYALPELAAAAMV